MNIPLANYETELNQFSQLLEHDGRLRILMFHGESGCGKTKLVESCMAKIPGHVHYATIQLRGGDTTAGHILYRLARRAQWARVPNLARQVASLQGKPEASTDLRWLAEMRGHIDAILQVAEVDERRRRRTLLTDAWFADLETFSAPFLLAVDTFEKASTEVDQWLVNHFLPWIAESSQMRVLLVGQKVPQPTVEWSHCSEARELKGIPEAEAWLPVAEAMGREVPSIDYLAGACAMADGKPDKILKFIEILPLVKPSAIKVEIDLKKVRDNLVAGFDDEELAEICFELGLEIEFKDLDGINRNAKARSLVLYMQRRGRLPELVDKGRELRAHLEW